MILNCQVLIEKLLQVKHLLVANQLKQLGTFDSIYFCGKIHFEDDGTQNYLVFQPMYKYVKRIVGVGNGNYIYYWKSKGPFEEKINSIAASRYKVTPQLSYHGTKTKVEFNGSCLKQDSVTFNQGKTVNIYIVYEINKDINISDYPILANSLFGVVRLTKNPDINKNNHSGYRIGFDRKGFFSIGNEVGRNVIIFGVDMCSSSHINNKKKDILILGKGPTQLTFLKKM